MHGPSGECHDTDNTRISSRAVSGLERGETEGIWEGISGQNKTHAESGQEAPRTTGTKRLDIPPAL